MPRLHYSPTGGTDTLCGVIGVSLSGPVGFLPVGVDCRLCLRRWREAEQRAAAAELNRTHGEAEARLAGERPDVPAEVLGAMTRPQQPLGPMELRTLARSIDGEDRSDAPRWGSWRGALSAWATWRDETVPIASGSSGDRFGGAGIGGGSAGPRTPPGTALDLIDVEHAMERAVVAAARALPAMGIRVSEAVTRAVAEARLAGVASRVKVPGRKSHRAQRVIPEAGEIGKRHGLTAHQVGLVCVAVMRELERQPVARVHVARRWKEHRRGSILARMEPR